MTLNIRVSIPSNTARSWQAVSLMGPGDTVIVSLAPPMSIGRSLLSKFMTGKIGVMSVFDIPLKGITAL